MLRERLVEVEKRYEELATMLASPEVLNDQNKLRETAKEHSDLTPVVTAYHELKKIDEDIAGNKELLQEKDEEMRTLAKEELPGLTARSEELLQELKIMLLPKDPNDEKSILLEIRAGTGGEESSLFAAEIFRMYCRYAEEHRWKVEVLSSNPTGVDGLKEVIAMIEGEGVYSRLKYESGVHRVQRVPETETQGRVHTSAVTVAVMPEAEEVEVDIKKDDLRIDTFRAGGHGGQAVNKLETAIRITHKPTGLVVSCQDEKSQHKNREKAMKVLASRMLDLKIQEQQKEISDERKALVGSGDRSEKIRTYNFPQNRVTDHRVGVTLHKLGAIMEGDLTELTDNVINFFQAEALRATEGGDE